MVRERTFAEALEHRRSYYSISNDSPVQDEEIVHIIHSSKACAFGIQLADYTYCVVTGG